MSPVAIYDPRQLSLAPVAVARNATPIASGPERVRYGQRLNATYFTGVTTMARRGYLLYFIHIIQLHKIDKRHTDNLAQ